MSFNIMMLWSMTFCEQLIIEYREHESFNERHDDREECKGRGLWQAAAR
jgi:hypothetical protein